MDISRCMMTFLALKQIALCEPVSAIEFDALEFDNPNEEVPVLVTPTRLKQSKHDIPASVTRIDAEELQDLQIRNIPQALRYVAGMAVGYASGNQPRINYHGTNGLIPRRMQILIDGMSVYRAGYADVSWPILPITIQDVRAIEITRAPSSPTYGQNSMMAVINIITNAPEQVQEPSLMIRYGDKETHDIYARFGATPSDALSYRVSIAKEQDEGFDTNFVGDERRDGANINNLNVNSNVKLSDTTGLNLFVGLSEGVTELEYREREQQSFPDIENRAQYYQADLRNVFNSMHELKVKTYFTHINQDVSWFSCHPQALFLPSLRQLGLQNSDYAAAIIEGQVPSGGTLDDDALALHVSQDIAAMGASAFDLTCGEANEDAVESKFDVEIEDTYIVSDKYRFVLGAGATKQSLESDTYIGGKARTWGTRLFGNSENRLGKFVVNYGVMIEEEETLDHPEVSPRFGVNYRVTPSNTIRYAVSRSVRTPDILETDLDWNYYVDEFSVPVAGRSSGYFYHNAKADKDLEPEEIISHEIGLYGYHNYFSMRTGISTLEYDIKMFYDKMDDLISEKLQFFDYHPTNNAENLLKGIEFEVDYTSSMDNYQQFIKKIKLHANYAYLDADTNNFYERSLYARHMGAFYSIFHFTNDLRISLAYYGNSEVNGESFDGFELAGGKVFRFGEDTLKLNAKAVYHPDKVNEFTVNETFNVQNNNDKKMNYYLTASYSF